MDQKELKAAIEEGQKSLQEKLDAKFAELKTGHEKEIEALKAEHLKSLEGLTSKEEMEKAVKAAEKEMQEQFDELATKFNKQGVNVQGKSLAEELKEKAADLKAIAKGSDKEIEIKAVSNRASVTDNEHAHDLPEIGQLATRRLSMYDLFPKLPVGTNNNGTIRYYDWDEATSVKAAAMVAESATFPESTAKFKKYSLEIQKIGDTLPVTEEFFEDEQQFASELSLFLNTNVKLKEDDQICNGDGTGTNLKGLLASIDAYTAVAEGFQDASIYDLIVKIAEEITTVGGAKYAPDVVIARQSVINKMKLKKDANNNYIIPPFVSRDGKVVDSMVVVESNIVPANTLVVGDRRFARIYEKTGYEASSARVGDQFLTDEMTLKVRKRLAFLIRNADKGGFRKVTDVDAALATLETAPV